MEYTPVDTFAAKCLILGLAVQPRAGSLVIGLEQVGYDELMTNGLFRQLSVSSHHRELEGEVAQIMCSNSEPGAR
jgi:hypothetical protein